MSGTILISPMGKVYAVTVDVCNHHRTYTADSLEEAKRRAERLCYILDLSPNVIEYLPPSKQKRSKKRNVL